MFCGPLLYAGPQRKVAHHLLAAKLLACDWAAAVQLEPSLNVG
jgi:hypothetical protein